MRNIGIAVLAAGCVMVSVSSGMAGPDSQGGPTGKELTLPQLIEQMEASRDRYESLQAEMTVTSYQAVDANSRPEVKFVREIISRWTPERQFWKIVQKKPTGNAGEPLKLERTTMCASCPEWTKSYRKDGNERATGLIRSGPVRYEADFDTVYSALWDRCEMMWFDRTEIYRMEVKYNRDTDMYELEAQLKPQLPAYTFYVDPKKGFIPVRRIWRRLDGTVLEDFTCSRVERIGGVWIPRTYSVFIPHNRWEARYEVRDIIVNQPVKDKLLDFNFPWDTKVRDERVEP